MIAALLRKWKRKLLAAEIADMEADIAALHNRRVDDLAGINSISRELSVARRQMHVLIQDDLRPDN